MGTLAKHEDPLEDLLSSALIEHSNLARSKTVLKSRKDADANYRACFTKAENWMLKSQVRLIHVDGTVRTLIGLFDELVHSYVPACRRLTAASAVNEALPQHAEEVTGPHWLPGEQIAFKRQPSEHKLTLVSDLTLNMGQHLIAKAVVCEASLVGGGLQRLCLMEDTVFEGSTPRTILQLPASLDILEGLLGGCKVLVWRQINEELNHAHRD
jgi:hypothetical protein